MRLLEKVVLKDNRLTFFFRKLFFSDSEPCCVTAYVLAIANSILATEIFEVLNIETEFNLQKSEAFNCRNCLRQRLLFQKRSHVYQWQSK